MDRNAYSGNRQGDKDLALRCPTLELRLGKSSLCRSLPLPGPYLAFPRLFHIQVAIALYLHGATLNLSVLAQLFLHQVRPSTESAVNAQRIQVAQHTQTTPKPT